MADIDERILEEIQDEDIKQRIHAVQLIRRAIKIRRHFMLLEEVIGILTTACFIIYSAIWANSFWGCIFVFLECQLTFFLFINITVSLCGQFIRRECKAHFNALIERNLHEDVQKNKED